ncbi:hypothetical protein L596_002584 [Steinernema carpocapsae]|uniref:Uncharacterized protein n=1 Tax=Steinernema carpocapsae TaxID=34508 RepID=A0A4U8UPM3_STECR|nr:hypothetical protein L596_002584 [Steinernema carpocapsae]
MKNTLFPQQNNFISTNEQYHAIQLFELHTERAFDSIPAKIEGLAYLGIRPSGAMKLNDRATDTFGDHLFSE